MKKLYFILPVVFAGIFFFFYMKDKTAIEEKVKADQAVHEKQLQERRDRDEEVRIRARKEAAIQAEKRAEEREKKRLADDAQKAEFQKAQDSLANARQERERVYKQVLKLQEDRTSAQDQLRRAREQFKLMQVQVDFVKNSSKDIAEKRNIFQQALTKLETAERAAAANEAARAAAASAKRS